MLEKNVKTAVFTIASKNYFAQVNTLLQSLYETNPNWDRYFAIADEPNADLEGALQVTSTGLIRMEDLAIPDLNDMKFRYDVMELNTAIKPFVMLYLQERYERVVYLDPDIRVFAEMEAVNRAFDEGYDFVVTPHLTGYFEDDGLHVDEPDIMRAGVYNFGFFAASASSEAKATIKWWAKKLEKLCINKQKEGIFVDQKWMDLLPGRHDKVCILREPGYNVAYWNLTHRSISSENGRYLSNGRPLVFFHFSGFKPDSVDVVSKYQNRHTMENIGAAKELFVDYAKAVLLNEYGKWQKQQYAYGKFLDDRKIHDVFRRIYREYGEVEQSLKLKNPFECSEFFYEAKELFVPLLVDYAVRDHENVGMYFIMNGRNQWVHWLEAVILNEYGLPMDFAGYATAYFSRRLSIFASEAFTVREIPAETEPSDGVNLIGYIRSEHGLGEACRLTAEALDSTDISWDAYDWEVNNSSNQNDNTWNKKISFCMHHNISIFNINADQLTVAREKLPARSFEGYRIGIWYWELTKFPQEWIKAFDLVDEIWAPTRFIKDNLERISPVPVHYMPPGIRRDDKLEMYSREYFGLPEDEFLFLNFYDAYSYSTRKNPEAAIKAFQMAFAPDDKTVGLVLKVNNATAGDEGIVKLQSLVGHYTNIHIFAKTMSRDEVNALIDICDVSVSLHRSEGLGLLCQESMYYGKPVIATGWSGNTDFMNDDNSCLVRYEMIPIGEYYGLNDPNQMWAEPDISHAAEYMARLRTDKEYYEKLAANAKQHIHTVFSCEVCGKRMEKRLKEILQDKENWPTRQKVECLPAKQLSFIDKLKGSVKRKIMQYGVVQRLKATLYEIKDVSNKNLRETQVLEQMLERQHSEVAVLKQMLEQQCSMMPQVARMVEHTDQNNVVRFNDLRRLLDSFQNNWMMDKMHEYGQLEGSKQFDHMKKMRTLLAMQDIPVGSGQLFRAGNLYDGGYMMYDQFKDSKIAYSFGISDDVSWDKDMAERGFDVYMYDHTIDGLPEKHEKFHWHKIGLSDTYDNRRPELRTLPQLLEDNGHLQQGHMILKIDIEGAEWSVLANISGEYLARFDQIVMEFHDMNKIEHYEIMEKALLNLNQQHQLVHVHGNNNWGYTMLSGMVMPDFIECTYVKKDLCEFVPHGGILPQRLDNANNPFFPDIYLGKWG